MAARGRVSGNFLRRMVGLDGRSNRRSEPRPLSQEGTTGGAYHLDLPLTSSLVMRGNRVHSRAGYAKI